MSWGIRSMSCTTARATVSERQQGASGGPTTALVGRASLEGNEALSAAGALEPFALSSNGAPKEPQSRMLLIRLTPPSGPAASTS
jgi:hypothetical protein